MSQIACQNCGTELHPKAHFCHHCGQNTKEMARPLAAFAREFFDAIFNLDNKIWVSLAYLLTKPGKLTHSYIEGKRARFLHPLRLFLTSTVLFFALFGYSIQDSIKFNDPLQTKRKAVEKYQQLQRLQQIQDSLRSGMADSSLADDWASYSQQVATTFADTAGLGNPQDTMVSMSLLTKELNLTVEQALLWDADTVIARKGITHWFDKALVRKLVKMEHKANEFIRDFLTNKLWWVNFLLVFFCAFALKVMLWRQYFSQHLVFCFEYGTVAEIAAMVMLSDIRFLQVVAFVWLVIYPVIAIRRVYGLSWPKTLAVTISLNLYYMFLMVLIMAVAFLVSILIF